MTPTLWHLKVSNFNEKARWALDYKRIPHVRRAVLIGPHRSVARRLTGGRTLPILELDGEAIGDSTRIIERLEERFPDPPLYPADVRTRRRALALEEFFDEELGPYTRLLAVAHLLPAMRLALATFTPDLSAPRRLQARLMAPAVRRRIFRGMGVSDESVAAAFQKCEAAGERFRTELQPNGYLAGDGFSVADLTAAALVAPVVAPVQFPYPQPQRDHPLLAPVREVLEGSGLAAWAREIYARHRGVSAAVADRAH